MTDYPCPTCEGRGELVTQWAGTPPRVAEAVPCPTCGATGYVDDEPPAEPDDDALAQVYGPDEAARLLDTEPPF